MTAYLVAAAVKPTTHDHELRRYLRAEAEQELTPDDPPPRKGEYDGQALQPGLRFFATPGNTFREDESCDVGVESRDCSERGTMRIVLCQARQVMRDTAHRNSSARRSPVIRNIEIRPTIGALAEVKKGT